MKVTTIIRFLSAIMLSFLAGSAIGHGVQLDPMSVGVVFAGASGALSFVPGFSSGMAMASAIDVADLVTDYEAYYKVDKGAAERRKRLKSKLYNTNAKFDSHFMQVETESTREEWAYSEQSEVLQPFQTGWTSKGNHTIHPNPTQLFWAKYDLDYLPDHLVNTWAGFLRGNNLGVDDCPFVQYVLEEHIIPRGHEDWKTKVSFLGEYVAPTPGTAGGAATTADGVLQKLIAYNGSGEYVPFTMGAVPSDPVEFVEYMEEMSEYIPEEHRDKMMTWRINDTLRSLYIEGFMEKYNKMFMRDPNEVTNLFIFKRPNIKVEGFTEMGTSDHIFITAKDNSLLLNKGSVKKEILKVETQKRQLFLFTDFHKGYHFINPTEIWGNDQGLS